MIQHVTVRECGHVCVGVGVFVSQVFGSTFHSAFVSPPMVADFNDTCTVCHVRWKVAYATGAYAVYGTYAAFGVHLRANKKRKYKA